MSARQEVVYERFTRGWNPYQVPKDTGAGVSAAHLRPRLLEQGQLVDARGLETTPDGVLRWRRDQFRIALPATATAANLRLLAEYKTDTHNQLLCICDEGANGVLHVLTADWTTAATQWTLGYEKFNGLSWSNEGYTLDDDGPYSWEQAGGYLFITCPGQNMKMWDGDTLQDVGLAPPLVAPAWTGSYEDSTDPLYVETDPDLVLTPGASSIGWASVPQGDAGHECRLIRDFGEEGRGDFDDKFKLNVTGHHYPGRFVLIARNNGATADWLNDRNVMVWVGDSGDGFDLVLDAHNYTGHRRFKDSAHLDFGVDYYLRFSRVGTTLTLDIHLQADRSDAPKRTVVEDYFADSFQYLTLAANWDYTDASASDSGTMSEIDLMTDSSVYDVSGILPQGNYRYVRTWGNALFESMPGPSSAGIVLKDDNHAIPLAWTESIPAGVLWQGVYRAYLYSLDVEASGSDWFLVGKVVPAPGAPTGTVGTAGSMGNGTYYYVITALDALGETIAGTQSAGKVVTGPSGSVVLAWAAVPEAVSYKVYRTTTSGVYTTPCYLGNPTAATYTDTALNASAGAPPAARTYEDNLPVEELGAQLLFDHALPPQGGKLVWHKDTLFLAAPSATSASYGTPETTNLSNVLFHSRLGEPFYWPGQSYFQIGNDEALLSPVSWGEYLFCWKANGFWALRGYDTSTWALEQITDRLGMVAANRAAAGPPGVLWADRRGLYLYDGTQKWSAPCRGF